VISLLSSFLFFFLPSSLPFFPPLFLSNPVLGTDKKEEKKEKKKKKKKRRKRRREEKKRACSARRE